jgi:hypothetical protein
MCALSYSYDLNVILRVQGVDVDIILFLMVTVMFSVANEARGKQKAALSPTCYVFWHLTCLARLNASLGSIRIFCSATEWVCEFVILVTKSCLVKHLFLMKFTVISLSQSKRMLNSILNRPELFPPQSISVHHT